MSAWIWVLASLSLRHTLFEWATELPSRWKGELGRRCDCVCNPQLKAEYYLVLSDYDTSPWRSAKGSTLDPSLAGLASVASCPGSPSYRRRCADAATDSGGEEAPLQQLAGVAVSVFMRVIHGARREATCTTLLVRRGYPPKCTIVLVYPHAEKVPSPTSLLLQYVRCASNHHYVWWFRECRASPCAAPSCLARVFVAHCRRRQHRAAHAG